VNTLSLPFFATAAAVRCLRKSETTGLRELVFSKRALGISFFFVLGLFPIFVDMLHHGRAYGVSFGLDLLQSWAEKLDVLFVQVLPLLFGTYLPGLAGPGPAVSALGEFLLFLLTAIAFLYCLFKYRRFFLCLVLLKPADYPGAFYLVSLLPPFLLLWFVSTYVHDVKNARYFILAVFLIPVYLTEFYLLLERRSRALAGAFWLLVMLAGAGGSWQFLASDPKEARYTNAFLTLIDHGHDAEPLVEFLVEEGLKVGYADYWIQMNLVYLSKEDLIYAAYSGNRYAPYLEKAREADFPTHVDFRGEVADPENRARRYSEEYGVPYEWREIEEYVVFYTQQARGGGGTRR
jgi:hypothetical protein